MTATSSLGRALSPSCLGVTRIPSGSRMTPCCVAVGLDDGPGHVLQVEHAVLYAAAQTGPRWSCRRAHLALQHLALLDDDHGGCRTPACERPAFSMPQEAPSRTAPGRTWAAAFGHRAGPPLEWAAPPAQRATGWPPAQRSQLADLPLRSSSRTANRMTPHQNCPQQRNQHGPRPF